MAHVELAVGVERDLSEIMSCRGGCTQARAGIQQELGSTTGEPRRDTEHAAMVSVERGISALQGASHNSCLGGACAHDTDPGLRACEHRAIGVPEHGQSGLVRRQHHPRRLVARGLHRQRGTSRSASGAGEVRPEDGGVEAAQDERIAVGRAGCGT
jgi:hypothetical protein